MAKVATMAAGFLFNILLARFAGVEYFGVFGLFLNLTFLCNVFSDWGFSIYGPLEVNRRDPENRKFYLTRVWNFKLVITIFSTLLYVVVVLFLYPDEAEFLLYGVVVTLLNLLNFDWLLRAYQRFGIVSSRLVFHSVLNLSLLIVLTLIDAHIKYVFLSYGFATLVSLVLGFIFVLQKKYLYLPSSLKAGALFRDTKYIVRETGYAFKSILVLNIIYSSNLLLLNLFGSNESASFYNSYYILFSSSASLIIISQDIFLPRFAAIGEIKFFRQYYGVAYPAALIIMLALLAMPFYFHLFFPLEYKLDFLSVSLISCLGLVHAYRLMFLHRFLIKMEYKTFLFYNFAALLLFSLFSSVFILVDGYDVNAAILSLIGAEAIVIVGSVIHQKLLDTRFAINLGFAGLMITGAVFFEGYIFNGLLVFFFLFFSFLFMKRLMMVRVNFNDLN